MTERSSPPRIASLLAGATEILYGLGLADAIVGISHECDTLPEILDRPRLTHSRIDDSRPSREIDAQVWAMMRDGAALYTVDADLLRRLRPTVIVTQAQCDVCAVSYDDVLAAIAGSDDLANTTVVAMNPMTLSELFRDIGIIGNAVGAESASETFSTGLRRRLDAVRDRVRGAAGATIPKTICIEWIEPLMVAANWIPDLIQAAGGRCDLTEGGRHSTVSDWGEVIDYDPHVVVVSPCGFDLARTVREAEALRALPEWRRLRAVREGRAYAVDGNAYFNRSGPRLIDSVEILAGLIHPERCGAFADRFAGAFQVLS